MGTSVYVEAEVTFQANDATASIAISGSGSTLIPSGTATSTVTVNISESIANVSISRTQLVLTGIVGTTAIYDISAYAADGFLLNAGNFSFVESEAWLSMQNAVGGGESVLLPVVIEFPSSDSTGAITVNGSAQAIGSPVVNIDVDFTNNVNGSSLTDASETFVLNHGQRISYTNTLTPDRGTFLIPSDVTITETADVTNVVAFTSSDAGGGAVNLTTSIIAPASGTSVSASIALGGTASEEPYVATINLTETLPYGKIINNTLAQRFGATDSSVVHNVTVLPIEGAASYPGTTTFTIAGGTASNYTYASGGVSFDLTIPLPTFDATFPIGNVSMDCSITGIAPDSGTSIRDNSDVLALLAGDPATAVSTTLLGSGLPAQGGSIVVKVTANGAWETGGNGIGTGFSYGPISGVGNGEIVFEVEYLANTLSSKTFGLVVYTTDTSNRASGSAARSDINFTQSDDYGNPRVVYVATLPATQQNGIIYITPN